MLSGETYILPLVTRSADQDGLQWKQKEDDLVEIFKYFYSITDLP